MDFENLSYIECPEYYPVNPYQLNKHDSSSDGSYKNRLQKLIAAKDRDEVIVEEIIGGANIYQRTENNISSLGLAISNRLENIIEKFLEIYKKDVETLKEHGWNGNDSSVLIAFGADQIAKIVNKLPSNLPSHQELPEKKIFILCKENNSTPVDVKILIQEDEADAKITLEIIDALSENGTIDIKYKSYMGNSILHLAAYEGYLNVIEGFLGFGEEFDCINNKNITPFGYACMENKLELVKFFHKKYNIEIFEYLKSSKDTVFGMAANGSWEVFDYLMRQIKKFLDDEHLDIIFDLRTEFHEFNLLYIAILNEQFEFVEKCLSYNPDVAKQDEYGENLLHFAMKVSNGREFSRMLIKNYPFLVSSEDNCRITPVHILATKGWFEEFVELYQRYPDLRIKFCTDPDNVDQIMMTCISREHFNVASFLLDNHEACFESPEFIAKLLCAAVVKENSLGFIKDLQKLRNFDVKVPTAAGQFAFIEALKSGCPKNFQHLLETTELEDFNAILDPLDQANLLYHAIHRSYEIKDNDVYFSTFNSLLLKGIDIHHKTRDGKTLLHRAVIQDLPQIASILMDMDLKGDEPDNEGKTPLHYVKSVEMLQALMEKTSAVTFFLQDKNEQTPLFTLMSYCKPYCADIALLENFLEYQPDLKLQDKNGFTVLHLAYDVDCAELLIKRGADVTMLSIYGENVLFKSVGTDQLGVGPFPKLAKFYLKNTEVDPYVVNKKGVSILGCIIGNKIDYKDVFLVHSDLFKEHLKRFHNGIDSNGDQILLTSLSKNDDFTLTFLLLKFDDIDVNIKSSDNSNLLHKLNFGSSRNAVQVARILIEKEVDINQSNDFGKTPLIQSVESSDTEKALFLMGLPKIDLDAQDLNGNTALHLAATCQNVRLICRLLIHGASSKIQNNEHKSFYHRLNNFNKSLFYFYDHPSNSL